MQSHEFSNRLIQETSPYLLQHAHNPVDWYPWGEEALAAAKSLDKPILVSIGYSACHWCHVMERESFEDKFVAEFMNTNFINIKIDREERPDLDHIYMEAVQVLTGSGGWPLNVFLTPDAKPFYGGTYFPPRQLYNRPSWLDVLRFINDIWIGKRNEVNEQALKLLSHINSLSVSFNNKFLKENVINVLHFNNDFFKVIKESIMNNADQAKGGFGAAPKFPQTMSIQYLLLYDYFYKDEAAKEHAFFSLKALLRGGIYDHLAGGISRYSTDENWLVPHFEKMLYDNALMVDVLCDAYQISRDDEFKKGIEDVIRFFLEELQNPEGGFFAALDADSDGEEGKYYTWQKHEIAEILGEDTAVFCDFFGVGEKGNWEGTNILHVLQPLKEFAKFRNTDAMMLEQQIQRGKDRLHEKRKLRNRPATDDKILLGWNALLLIALCKASAALENSEYRNMAENLFDFLCSQFSEDGLIRYHSCKHGIRKNHAFLEDYAYFIRACISLQELTGKEKYLYRAKDLNEYVINHFKQEQGPMFYYTCKDQIDIIVRKVEIYDGALPSANAVMAENLHYLSKVFDKKEWENMAMEMFIAMREHLNKYPASFSWWNSALLKIHKGYKEIVITGNEAHLLQKKVLTRFLPNKVLQASAVEKNFPLLKSKNYSNTGLIYVCENFECSKPVNDLVEFDSLFL